MEQPTVRQLESYKDDSVIATYSDGSKLMLSACGASFLHVDSTSHSQSIPSKIQQNTQFAISRYRYKLRCALEFRNKFAEKPFLCDLSGNERKEVKNFLKIVKSFKNSKNNFLYQVRNRPIEVITWPLCHHCIKQTSSGSLVLHSVDNNAHLELMSNGRVFTVTYWVAVSSNKRDCDEIGLGIVHYLLTHWCSVSDVPDVWAQPIELLVTARNKTECCHNNKQAFSMLSHSLPIMCRNVHLHHWEKVIEFEEYF